MDESGNSYMCYVVYVSLFKRSFIVCYSEILLLCKHFLLDVVDVWSCC